MTYLYLLAFMFYMNLAFVLMGYWVHVRWMRVPINKMQLGFPKLFEVRLGGIPLEVGLLPLFSSLDFTDEFLQERPAKRMGRLRVINICMQYAFLGIWLLVGGVSLATLSDCFAVAYFQMSMDQFVVLHGALDLWTVGAFAITFACGTILLDLVLWWSASTTRKRLPSFIHATCMLGLAVIFVRLCILLWGM
jgi:membrane-associated protease RseP (regulator of RpoE activity)